MNINKPENYQFLSEEQKEIFDAYKEGKNIFVTGPGGCGKSFLIKTIVEDATLNNIKINVCALTGCAAVLLGCGAKTLHSWAGIGLAKGNEDTIVNNISLNRYKKKNWTSTNLLIIDEVSMMSMQLFNLLDRIGKTIRKNSKPFGGIQLIFSGDFYQLPPVGDKKDPETSMFAFESQLWNETFDYQFLLDKVFRQKDDTYINILNEVRHGEISKKSIKILKSCIGKSYDPTKNIKPVYILPIKRLVDDINNKSLNQLTTPEVVFTYETSYKPSDDLVKQTGYKKPSVKQLEIEENYIISNALFEPKQVLKIGAQVMCIVNLDLENGICNGSTGVIRDFVAGFPKVEFFNGVSLVITRHSWVSDNIPGFCINQIPLVLAWAVTIHKSQGATLDCAEVDIGSNIFASGQSYVALSRVKSLDGLYLKSFNSNKIKTDQKVIEFYKQFYVFEQEENDIEVEVEVDAEN